MITLILSCIVGLLLIAVGALAFACFNLTKKVETYETWIEQNDQILDELKAEIEHVHTELKSVDERNLFDKDDDVGFVFTEIVRIIKTFNDRIKGL